MWWSGCELPSARCMLICSVLFIFTEALRWVRVVVERLGNPTKVRFKHAPGDFVLVARFEVTSHNSHYTKLFRGTEPETKRLSV